MDNIREMWSLPWHALQRNLVRGNQLAAMDEPRAVSRDTAIPYEEMSAA